MDKDHRSLEHKIRDVVEASMNRNTDLRRKVVNVGRPDTAESNFDPKSKLAKQGELKTKIIDETSHTDKDKKEAKKGDDKDDKESKAGPSKAEDEFTGGKTEIDFEPKTNDKSTIDSDDKSKKTKKVTKEETMLKSDNKFGLPQDLIDAVTEAMMKKKPTEEELKGDQHKIDKNKNGKIDAHDFKLLRKEEAEEIDEAVKTDNEAGGFHRQAYHAAKGEDKTGEANKAFSKAHSLVKKHAADHLTGVKNASKMVTHYLDSKHGRHLHGNENNASYVKKDFGNFKKNYKPEMHEEVEQIDELSKDTLSRYAKKATTDRWAKMPAKGDSDPMKRGQKHFAKRMKGANLAHDKMDGTAKVKATEEFEQIDEVSDDKLSAYRAAAKGKGREAGRELALRKMIGGDGAKVDATSTKPLVGINKRGKLVARARVREDVELSAEELARIEEIAKGL